MLENLQIEGCLPPAPRKFPSRFVPMQPGVAVPLCTQVSLQINHYKCEGIYTSHTFAQFWADRIHIDPYNCLVWRCTAIHQMVCLSSKSHCGLTRITFTTSSSIGRASGKASSESTPKTWIGLAWPCYAFFSKSSQRNVRLV